MRKACLVPFFNRFVIQVRVIVVSSPNHSAMSIPRQTDSEAALRHEPIILRCAVRDHAELHTLDKV